jgi:Holliday junction resolvase RusA-like endonuclease
MTHKGASAVPTNKPAVQVKNGDLLVYATIPGLPPSVNNIWKPHGRGIYKNPIAKEWQERTVWILRQATGLPVKTYGGEVSYLLLLIPATLAKMDGDNRVKLLQDCLQMSGIIKDDSQVKDHRVILASKGGASETVVYLWAGNRLPDEEVQKILRI